MAGIIDFKPVYLPVNQGHGNARRLSLSNCRNNLVALMDADDISMADRFEKQLCVFCEHADLHIVGAQITEFIGEPEHIVGKRIVPQKDAEIKEYMKKRCPMNQVTVMMKKDFVQQAGGYLDWYCEEDYYLWIRMALSGGKFANVQDALVNVRIGDEMSARRGGWKYFCSEARLQGYMLRKKVIGLPRYLYNVAVRFGGEVLLPNKLRTRLFKRLRAAGEIERQDYSEQGRAPAKAQGSYPPFSVAMCVYGGDCADWFDAALDSVVNQTVPPDEIVLVVDGPIPGDIQRVIDKYREICADRANQGIVGKLYG